MNAPAPDREANPHTCAQHAALQGSGMDADSVKHAVNKQKFFFTVLNIFSQRKAIVFKDRGSTEILI